MPYIGNTIRAADDYRLIDDISSSFNGSTTSFALQVAGSSPVPFPKSPQQVLISVNGVIQEPDPTGASGFNLVGTNIVFSSAPTNGHAFFGIIYATADYLNAGGEFPAGSVGAPSFTFTGDQDTGIYRKGSGSIGFVSNATEIANTDSNGITISSGNLILGDSGSVSDDRLTFGAGTDLSIYHDPASGGSSFIDVTGVLQIHTSQLYINNEANTERLLRCTQDDSVELYFDGSKKLETTSGGVAVTGNITATGAVDSVGMTIGGNTPTLNFTDANDNPDFRFLVNSNSFILEDTTNSANRFVVNSDGHIDIAGNVDFGNGIDVTGSITVSGTVDGVDVAALSSSVSGKLSNVVDDTTPQLGGNLDCNNKVVTLNDSTGSDNNRFKIGNGADLEIYHDGTHSRIDNSTNALLLQTTSNSIQLNKGTSENMLVANVDGSVDIYFDSTKRFETTSGGSKVTGNFIGTGDILLDSDSHKLKLGLGEDLLIHHNGTNSVIDNNTGDLFIETTGSGDDIYIKSNDDIFLQAAADEDGIKIIGDGTVELFYDGTKKLDTRSSGVGIDGNLFFADSSRIYMGDANDFQLFHDGTNTHIVNSTGTLVYRSDTHHFKDKDNSDTHAKFVHDGAVELYYDNSKKFETLAGGVQWTGAIKNPTDGTDQGIYFGVDNDLQISHDGSSNHIKGTGNHFTRFWTGNTNRWNITNDGHFRPEANNAYDIGASNQRVRNIYTNDLNLSNEGSSNDVDGTWGNYTIQEGAEDLFLINRRNGKKFKFNLTEVA